MDGEGSRQRLFSTCEAGVAQAVAPGLVALVERQGASLYHEAHGLRASRCGGSGGQGEQWVGAPAQRDDIFDLASLTKVLCTTILAAQLVSEGTWTLDEPLPGPYGGPWKQSSLADVLAHCSGYPAHVPFYRDYSWPSQESRDSVLHRVLNTPAEYPLRSRAVYSDLGFIALGAALEWQHGKRLDQLFEDRVARLLGLDRAPEYWVGFLPLDHPSEELPPGLDERILPSEVYQDPEGATPASGDYQALRYRWAGPERWARGQVHDDNAYCMLGVAGHAGLFGSAAGVAQIARAWLLGDPLQIAAEVRERFEQRWPGGPKDSTRALGWDGVAAQHGMSPRAFCHLGYTGTGLWIDPEGGDAFCLLLSHRVHRGRGDAAGIRGLRQRFCQASVALMDL